MKYFTIATLALLAGNSYVSGATTTTESTSTTPATPTTPETESFAGKLISDTKEFFEELSNSIKHVFYPANNVIKARLEIPKPKDAGEIVQYAPQENLCAAGNETEYWENLFTKKDPETIIKIVFCPNAIDYLVHTNNVNLAGRAKDQDLRNLLVALTLRSETLNKSYQDSFMLKNYFECFKILKTKLKYNNDPWPCKDAATCDAASVKDNFSKFAEENESCKAVLKDQLVAYADKVTEAITEQKLQSSVAVRAAILENLNDTPHLSLPFVYLFDGVVESNKNVARASIEQAIRDTCGTLDMQLSKNSTVCNDARADAEKRLGKSNPSDATTSGEAKPVDNLVSEPAKKDDAKDTVVQSTDKAKDTDKSKDADMLKDTVTSEVKNEVVVGGADKGTTDTVTPTKTDGTPTKTEMTLT